MCSGACRREALSQDAALQHHIQESAKRLADILRMRDEAERWKAEANRYRTALKAIHTVASKDGVAPELDRCYVYAANALMGKTEVDE